MQQLIAIVTVKPSILSSSQFTAKYATTILNSFGLISPEINISLLKLFSTLAASYLGKEVVASVDAVSFFQKMFIMSVQSLIENISDTLDWMVYILKFSPSSLHPALGKVGCKVIEIQSFHEKEESISQKALSFLYQIESLQHVVD